MSKVFIVKCFGRLIFHVSFFRSWRLYETMSTANPTSTPKPTKKHQNQSKNGGKSKNESGSSSGAKSKSAEASADGASSSGGIFRPLVVLALPGVNLFRRFSQYKRLPQDPPKDKLEVELERLNSKIVSLFLLI